MSGRLVAVSLNVMPDTDADAAKVTEVLTRTAIGLALDGIGCDVRVTPFDPEPEEG